YREVPDLVARICGICPVAYQMSAVHAIEHAFGGDPGPWVRAMRRLYYCGEWMQSHSLHIHLLAAPDFLGYPSVLAMAKAFPDEVRRGLALQGLGNALIRLLGARSVHPVGARVGGFWRAPESEEAQALLKRLEEAVPLAESLVAWTASLNLPAVEQPFTCVALRHPGEYPMNAGRIASDAGLDIAVEDFERHVREHQVPYSTALHAHLDGRPYLVGPLARINLNAGQLHPEVRRGLAATGIAFPSRNMYHSIVARAAEIHYAVLEAIRLLEDYRRPDTPYAELPPRAGAGFGATEAPRGLLWHRYELDGQGVVTQARIVPPTSQNQARIEEDLRLSLERAGLDSDEDTLRRTGEMVIRNYDPCISCATHFLTLRLHRQ
ncbi:MAG: nickel-dependent hydrogenase large subunit, partial [Pseudomonadota bacterium]|nr:nickel-dependent hydrogenase large subunit [Pseudomonadota bacterium]